MADDRQTAFAVVRTGLVPAFTDSRPSAAGIRLRAFVCLVALLAGSTALSGDGGAAYFVTALAILTYAALTLPLLPLVALFLVGALGPHPGGSVLIEAAREDGISALAPAALAFATGSIYIFARNWRRSEDALRSTERRLLSVLDSMPLGVFVLSTDGKLDYANDSARRLVGPPAAEIAAGSLTAAYQARTAGSGEPYPEERLPAVRALAGETSSIDDVELVRDGEPINLQFWGAPIRDEAGQISHAVSAFTNITAQKRFEAALLESEERFRTVFEEGPLGMAILGPDDRLAQVNQAFCQLTGYRGDELASKTYIDITYPDDRTLEALDSLRQGDREFLDIEKRYVHKDGHTVWVRVSVRVVHNAIGGGSYKLLMVQDISEQRRAQALIEHMAYADPLTDIPNRRLFYDRLGQAIARARRHNSSLVLISIDLDDFKSVNDAYGHDAGDALLIETSARLRACIRDSDTVARMSADEFLVLLTDTDVQAAEVVRDRITSRLRGPVGFAGSTLVRTASTGMAALGEDGITADSLVSAAEARMAEDKAGNRVAQAG